MAHRPFPPRSPLRSLLRLLTTQEEEAHHLLALAHHEGVEEVGDRLRVVGARPAAEPRYHRVVYLTSPAARGVVDRAATSLPAALGARLTVRDLPPGAFL